LDIGRSLTSLLDALILNRNLRLVTDNLVRDLDSREGIGQVHVVDAGSRPEEVSKRTLIRDDSDIAIKTGLRINRGFNLGLEAWMKIEEKSEWVLLVPNDSVVLDADVPRLLEMVSRYTSICAIIPVNDANAYDPLIDKTGIAIGWNFYEGPLIVRTSYVQERLDSGITLFDNDNFRGYASFLELAFQAYAADNAIAISNLVRFREDNHHLLKFHQLIGTESPSENTNLLVAEGKNWLLKKYGFHDRRNLELATRLLFEEFRQVHPEIPFKSAV
jgi:hypothetical protein